MKIPDTLQECFDIYLNQGQLYSPHTRSAYTRSVDLLFEFLDDHHFQSEVAIQQSPRSVAQISPRELGPEDHALLAAFAEWLRTADPDGNYTKRPYSEATIALRVAGVQHFLFFMERRGWLADDFNLSAVVATLREAAPIEQKQQPGKAKNNHYMDLSAVISFYDNQQPPPHLRGENVNAERLHRWELVRLRNRALLHCLAETGGRVSELLQLDAVDVAELNGQHTEIAVVGKSGHTYQLVIDKSQRMISEYLHKRGVLAEFVEKQESSPLFVSHDPRYDGNRMSRIVAWRVVRRASKGVGIANVSPHDFRHWRAHQLILEGRSLTEVRDMLGHRSIETVKLLYEHLLA